MIPDERETVIIPTHELYTDFLIDVSDSLVSEISLLELVSDACTSLQYMSAASNLPRYSEQLFDKMYRSVYESTQNDPYAKDVAGKVSKAWLLFTMGLREVILRCNLYIDDSFDYYYLGEDNGDIVLAKYPN